MGHKNKCVYHLTHKNLYTYEKIYFIPICIYFISLWL